MSHVQPEVEMEILIFNMADYTRQGVADSVNSRRGTNLSTSDVSEVVNSFEDEFRNSDVPMQVAGSHLGRGFLADMGDEVGSGIFREFLK